MSIPVSQFITPPPPPPPLSLLGVHIFILYICVSVSALQTGTSFFWHDGVRRLKSHFPRRHLKTWKKWSQTTMVMLRNSRTGMQQTNMCLLKLLNFSTKSMSMWHSCLELLPSSPSSVSMVFQSRQVGYGTINRIQFFSLLNPRGCQIYCLASQSLSFF